MRRKLKTSLKYSKQFSIEERKLLYGLYSRNLGSKNINFETFIAFASWDVMMCDGRTIFTLYA